jgi:hypothetical protein
MNSAPVLDPALALIVSMARPVRLPEFDAKSHAIKKIPVFCCWIASHISGRAPGAFIRRIVNDHGALSISAAHVIEQVGKCFARAPFETQSAFISYVEFYSQTKGHAYLVWLVVTPAAFYQQTLSFRKSLAYIRHRLRVVAIEPQKNEHGKSISVMADPVINEIKLGEAVELINGRLETYITFELVRFSAVCIVAADLPIIKTEPERVPVVCGITKEDSPRRMIMRKMFTWIYIPEVIRSTTIKAKLFLAESSFPRLCCRNKGRKD